ncbi:MAG: hypothetical protein AAFZ80_11365, partial [Cyanobacteria bacterium P01_A01_bin.105]
MVTQLASRKILGINQRAYQCLKLALSLNLRRQILIAVCDNVVLQNQLAAQLEADLGEPDALTQAILPDRTLQLSRLTLDPTQTDFVAQVAQWLQQQPAGQMPCLQLLGIEQMTRQSLMAQRHFLQSLEAVESLLPHLNTSLLLWLPWPWLRAIQQSAPQFWRWRSGLFEFAGEPTPVVTLPNSLTDRPEEGPVVNQVVPTSSLYGESVKVTSAPAVPDQDAETAPIGPVDLWTLLSEDLAQLEASEASLADPAISAAAPETDLEADLSVGNMPAEGPLVLPAELPAELLAEELSADPPTDEPAVSPAIDFAHIGQPFEVLAELKRSQRPPAEIAQAYLALGHHYRGQIEAGAMTP